MDERNAVMSLREYTAESVHGMWPVHRVEHCSAVKENQILPRATTQRTARNVTPTERGQM